MISDQICTDLITKTEFIIPDNSLPITTFKFDIDAIKEQNTIINDTPTVLIVDFGVENSSADISTGKLIIVF